MTLEAPVLESWDMTQWAKPEYSRQAVKRAGRALGSGDDLSFERLVEVVSIVDNWRAVHSYPLTSLNMHLRQHSHKIDRRADVVRRLKRYRSIEGKLRKTSLNLLQMQDLGGCRSVARDIGQASAITHSLKRSRSNHDLYNQDDYILGAEGLWISKHPSHVQVPQCSTPRVGRIENRGPNPKPHPALVGNCGRDGWLVHRRKSERQ